MLACCEELAEKALAARGVPCAAAMTIGMEVSSGIVVTELWACRL